VNWLKKLTGRLNVANSKTGARVEQSEMSRTTVKFVEIMVEHRETTNVEQSIRPVFDIGLESGLNAPGADATKARAQTLMHWK
jgi:hypothetical protein